MICPRSFVAAEGEQEDIYIPETETKGALDGDTVKIAICGEPTGKRREGKVLEIIDAGIIDMSENPDNFALRTFSSAAELREFYHHFMPVHCTERFLFRNKNIAGKSPVVRHDKAEALPALEGSDQLVAAPLCNLQ